MNLFKRQPYICMYPITKIRRLYLVKSITCSSSYFFHGTKICIQSRERSLTSMVSFFSFLNSARPVLLSFLKFGVVGAALVWQIHLGNWWGALWRPLGPWHPVGDWILLHPRGPQPSSNSTFFPTHTHPHYTQTQTSTIVVLLLCFLLAVLILLLSLYSYSPPSHSFFLLFLPSPQP